MDYFVYAKDSPYYHWQLELLIESFKLYKLEDRLAIFLSKTNESRLPQFFNNLKEHKRLFIHEDLGSKRGCEKLNLFYSLTTAIENNLISQPFVKIEPHVVLFKPLAKPTANITFQIDPCLSLDHIRKHTNLEHKTWLPIGETIVFNNISKEFFYRNSQITENILCNSLLNEPILKNIHRVGLVCNLLEYKSMFSYDGRRDMEMNLLDHKLENNFINYEHGMPPTFNKEMFLTPHNFTLSDKTPFQILAENTPTSSSHYIGQLAFNLC